MKKIKILHLEDNADDSELILSEIESKDYIVDYTRVENGPNFINELETNTFDIVLADNSLPTYDGISALKVFTEKHFDFPFIFVTGTLGEEIAIEMLKRGASDYILKQNIKRLVPAIEHSLKEEELKRQKINADKRYESFINTAADIIFTLDEKNCVITSLNPAFEKHTGFIIDDYIGKPFANILNKEDAQTFFSAYGIILKEHHIKTVIIRVKTKTGECIYLEVTAQPLFEIEKLTGVLCIARDITDSIKAEEKIKKLSVAVEQSPVSIVITDLKGDIEYVNPKFTDITGYMPEEVIGKNSRILKSEETPSKKYEELWETITTGGEWRGEFHNKKKNGKLYWEFASISAIKNNDGVITHFLAVKKDITDIKMKETELIEAKEKAEESNRLKSCFLANMSHELKTPMFAILGFSEILSEILEEKEAKEYAEMIYEGGGRLMETLNLILNLSLIESEKLTISLRKLDIIKEVIESINFFRKTAEKKNLFLKTETQYDSLNVYLDPGIIRQVINNMIDNAIKFTVEGGITVNINKEVKGGKTFAAIRVKDTGIGIPKDMQDIIWEEYRQVSEGLNRSFEGTGLGLSITKKFVSKLRGDIFLEESEIGKGSVFTVLFPYDEDIQTNTGQIYTEEKKEKPGTISESTYNEDLNRILYVEDDPGVIEVVKIFLKDLCLTDSAEDGVECIRKVKENKYTMILMDINLGKGLDGLQTAQIVRTIPGYEKIPIIAVTAFTMVGDKEEFLQKGCTHYISKPFASSELKALIKNVLSENR